MSVAFTREEDSKAAAAHLPDRPISPHPNLVTKSGLQALEAALEEAQAGYARAQSSGEVSVDRTAMARATRELRYASARRASAQLTEADLSSGVVQFGSTVTFEREDGRRQAYRIVGEDEADPKQGLISYVSPLARALLGRAAGEEAQLGSELLEVVTINAG